MRVTLRTPHQALMTMPCLQEQSPNLPKLLSKRLQQTRCKRKLLKRVSSRRMMKKLRSKKMPILRIESRLRRRKRRKRLKLQNLFNKWLLMTLMHRLLHSSRLMQVFSLKAKRKSKLSITTALVDRLLRNIQLYLKTKWTLYLRSSMNSQLQASLKEKKTL